MDKSPLGKLPAELSDNIYELVLVHNRIDIVIREHTHPYIYPTGLGLSLLSTCKQIRQECLPILFGKNHFFLHVGALQSVASARSDHAADAAVRLLYCLDEGTMHLRTFTIALGTWDVDKLKIGGYDIEEFVKRFTVAFKCTKRRPAWSFAVRLSASGGR